MGVSASKHPLNEVDENAHVMRSTSFHYYGTNHDASSQRSSCTIDNQSHNGIDGVDSSTDRLIKEGALSVNVKQSGLRSAFTRVNRGKKKKYRTNLIQSAPGTPSYRASDDIWCSSGENKLRSIKVRLTDEAVEYDENGPTSFRCTEPLDGGSGLKILLSPVTTPSSRSVPASSRFANSCKNISPNGRHDFQLNDDHNGAHDVLREQASGVEGMGDSEEPGSPLFDPSILASFERAIEVSTNDKLQAPVVSSSSPRFAYSTSNIYSDADSPNWSENPSVVADKSGTVHLGNDADQSPFNDTTGNIFASNTNSLFQYDYLQDFELKCPDGCEEKIVLYYTTLRGVRKTYENCCLVKSILKGFGVTVDARDIWMHSKFKQELMDVMGAALHVPSLFIKGRYIGGAEDVKRLHDDGILEHLLKGFPPECDEICEWCGDYRFIPCSTCNGSCKLVSSNEVFRCPDCNENGLILCSVCRV
ncbi:hypothetical protein KP509_18G003000 [Ceratopteris richardii]|uniref:Glutaredoxin domain-containing protein n=1 Tax=Ceratopteris richardii TaxID=49495 RepID=A0A8T2SQR0_CERRI|nr:hypothetical protein KP509_18G003000 [Ceratopteris richardii]KAH7364998.1 hypothetical protein KP509_18G003000 [Ceratopteris richardii]KAH7364999.1 hypothetical protein KP509_18G003000 [Ceratopteris richardii]KAH7365000.1 hypothetical protein KP509_18G003000 [Ceratopteris richardii]